MKVPGRLRRAWEVYLSLGEANLDWLFVLVMIPLVPLFCVALTLYALEFWL